MSETSIGLFIVWRIFQRRSESLAEKFNLSLKYYYFPWEERSRLHKAFSYIVKTIQTIKDLLECKSSVVFIQLPPTPVLYIAAAICKFTHKKLVADCHNAMIYSKWLKWPFAKYLLRTADTLIVHNKDVEEYAKGMHIDAITLHDPLPILSDDFDTSLTIRYPFMEGSYIIVPWSFAPDEPISELVRSAAMMPKHVFVMTWNSEKLPDSIKNNLPSNIILTGYLNDKDFTAIFSQATTALVLTTREGTQPSGASEAIALGVPLILSDLKTTRRLYEDMPIYIDNTADGIQYGVERAYTEQEECKERVNAFKTTLSMRLDAEISEVKSLLQSTGQLTNEPT